MDCFNENWPACAHSRNSPPTAWYGRAEPSKITSSRSNGIPGTCSITIRPMLELHSKGLLVGLTFEPFFSVTYHPDHSWWRFDSWNAATELLRHQCARVILEQGLINQNCQDCTPLAVWGISPSCWLAQIQQQKKQVQKCNDNFGYLACVNHFNCRIRVIHFMENCALRAE